MAHEIPPVTTGSIDLTWLRHVVGPDARTVLEVGANHGQHTQLLLAMFPKATLHAFEPDARALEQFRRAVSDRRVELHEIALGATNGRAEFHASGGMRPGATPQEQALYPKGWDQSGSLKAPKSHLQAHPWCKFVRTVKVEVRTMDTWARKHGVTDVDFVWADVQGAEGDMVRGGAETLARTRYLYCEYSDTELYEGQPNLSALLDMLPGFEVMRRFPDDVLLRNVALSGTGA
jgi:FkbM family methyltransferase